MMKRKAFLQSLLAVAGGASILGPVSRQDVQANPLSVPWPSVESGDEDFWNFVRGQFPLTHERAYLNTGGLGASPFVVINAVQSKMLELETISETGHSEELWKEIKTGAAALLGCSDDELAFTRNATEGINIVANGLPFRRGDEVITTTQEHVGNALTWMALAKREGIAIKFFEPSTASQEENLDRIGRLITSRTRLVSIPHALTTTGTVLPVREIAQLARQKKFHFFIDGAQTAGMMPFNLHDIGCDAYATSGHKWLLGPKETGLLYVRKDMLDTIRAKWVGAYSDGGFDFLRGTFAFHPGAQRYEYGTVSIPLRVGLGAAISFIRKIGIERIWRHNQTLASTFVRELTEMPEVKVLSPAREEMRSAMITIAHTKVGYQKLQEHCDTLKLRTRAVTEGGLQALRCSFHLYNTPEEVARIIEAVRTAPKG